MGIFGSSRREKALIAENEQLKRQLLPEHNTKEILMQQIRQMEEKIINLNKDFSLINERIKEKENTLDGINIKITAQKRLLSIYDTDLYVLDYGIYKPTYEFANSDLYKDKLKEIRDRQKEFIKNDMAASGSTDWTVNGNASKGRTMVNDTKKLLLRAFNVECDDIVANVKISNLERSVERITKISEQISKLGRIMNISITPQYIQLKIAEVKLALDYQQKKLEEKERLKELKLLEREEAKAQKEIEEERKRLKKEQAHYQNALTNLLIQIEKKGETEELLEKKQQLENVINETNNAIQNVDYRAANRKAGYVYIISNIGAFGKDIYKIGMTRRLDPHERIDELGDASVPFNFDIHALIFSEDAPALEAALHNAFESRKLNKINSRREFFAVSLDEIKEEVRRNFDKTVDWIDVAEAEQYRQSLLL